MPRLNDLLRPEHVLLDIITSDMSSLFHVFAEALGQRDGLNESSQRAMITALCGRESLGGTCVGHGVAIPHAYLSELTAPLLMVARLNPPVNFDTAPDHEPVDLVFMVAGPRSSPREHLQLLARLVRVLRDNQCLNRLRHEDSPEGVVRVLLETEGRVL